MVRISIDTDKDSVHTIQKIIALLEHVVQGHIPLQKESSFSSSQSTFSSSDANRSLQTNYVDVFGNMPTSEPIKNSSLGFTDLFASTSTSEASTSSLAPAPSMFDMFSDDAATTNTSPSFSSSSSPLSSSADFFSNNSFSSSSVSSSNSLSASSLLEESDAFSDEYDDDEFETPKKSESLYLKAYDD